MTLELTSVVWFIGYLGIRKVHRPSPGLIMRPKLTSNKSIQWFFKSSSYTIPSQHLHNDSKHVIGFNCGHRFSIREMRTSIISVLPFLLFHEAGVRS